MATANVNSFVQGASYVTQESLARTNPYAADGSDAQAVELFGIDVYGDRHSIAFTWAVTTADRRPHHARPQNRSHHRHERTC